MKNSLSFDWCNMKFYELKRRKQHSGGGRAHEGATGGTTSPVSPGSPVRSCSISSNSSSCSPSPSPTPSTPCRERDPGDFDETPPYSKGRTKSNFANLQVLCRLAIVYLDRKMPAPQALYWSSSSSHNFCFFLCLV